MYVAAGLIDELMHGSAVERRLRFAVHADDLLTRGMGHPGEHTGFGDGVAPFDAADAAHRNTLSAEGLKQQASRFVVANHAYRKHGHSQIGEIIDRVACAARDYGALPMTKDQSR